MDIEIQVDPSLNMIYLLFNVFSFFSVMYLVFLHLFIFTFTSIIPVDIIELYVFCTGGQSSC